MQWYDSHAFLITCTAEFSAAAFQMGSIGIFLRTKTSVLDRFSFSRLGPARTLYVYGRAFFALFTALGGAALIGALVGLAFVPTHSFPKRSISIIQHNVLFCPALFSVLRTMAGMRFLEFDSTLGFPGEGPCSLCSDAGHNVRTCPFMLLPRTRQYCGRRFFWPAHREKHFC